MFINMCSYFGMHSVLGTQVRQGLALELLPLTGVSLCKWRPHPHACTPPLHMPGPSLCTDPMPECGWLTFMYTTPIRLLSLKHLQPLPDCSWNLVPSSLAFLLSWDLSCPCMVRELES